jgi:tetratricopeptide (TPR) repeat protein
MRRHTRAQLIFLGAVLGFVLAGNTMVVLAAEKTVAMREMVYEKLSRAQEATEAGEWEKAYGQLARVEKMKDLTPSEMAQLHTAYGYTYFAQEKYSESAAAYEKVLQQEDLAEAMRTSTLYTLGQLNFHLDHFAEAAGYLEDWLAAVANPGPEAYVLLGQAYYQLGRLDEAAAPVRQAISIAAQRDDPVRENWYALLRVIYYETQDYDKLLETLEILVTRFQAKEYWVHLSAAYGEIGDTQRQLAAFELAYAQGYLQSSAEIVMLSQLLLQAEVPYRAGALLQDGLDNGSVTSNAANWRLLSQAWMLAQEYEAAIVSLGKAAEISDDGELYARLAQTHANLNQWEQSLAAAGTALDKGVKSPQDLHLMRGMGYFELGRYTEAKAAFGEAQKSEQSRDKATRWLAYVQSEEARLAELGIEP